MNDLAMMLGAGAAPAAPLPSGPPAGLDPLAAALAGGGAMSTDPALAGMPMPAAPAGFPSADPAMVGMLLEQLLTAQQADHAALQEQQAAALLGNPLLEALVSGAPLSPGAGQDAQGIAPTGDIPPAPLV